MAENSVDLQNVVSEIEAVVRNHALELSVRRSRDQGVPSSTELRSRALVHELEEVVTILRMVDEVLAGLSQSSARMWQFRAQAPSDSGSMPLEPEHAKSFMRHLDLVARLRVLVKVLYEWMYHLSELLKTLPLQNALSESVARKLDSYCELRNKLIAHQQYATVDLMKGTLRAPGDFAFAQLMLMPLTPPQNGQRILQSLFERCADKLLPQERVVENFYERCQVITNALERFSDDRRGEIISFIERYGAPSDTPIGLALFLRELVTELGRHLWE